MKRSISAAMIACAFMLMAYGTANARVKGVCQACHTMHNSQGGQPMAKVSYLSSPSAQPFWSGNAINAGTANTSTPNEYLLRADCIGCHSNTGTQTIVYYMSNKVPIVHNTQKPAYEVPGANNALAGGNFYWTDPNSGTDFADNHGHNVFSVDQTLAAAPGITGGGHCQGGSGTNSCHYSLYNPYDYQWNVNIEGCRGCHFFTFHHKAKGNSANIAISGPIQYSWQAGPVDPTYRFLDTYPGMFTQVPYWNSAFVQGIEDPNFEQSPSATVHNVYMANGASTGGGFVPAASGMMNASNHSLSGFCVGCHGAFHNTADSSGVWIRHPIDVLVGKLVDDGHESTFYNGTTGYETYDPKVPAAYGIANPYGDSVSGYGAVDDTRGQVTCVSCHRTHASPYPSMLRFDYNVMIAGNSAANPGSGCFACHTEKALE